MNKRIHEYLGVRIYSRLDARAMGGLKAQLSTIVLRDLRSRLHDKLRNQLYGRFFFLLCSELGSIA